MSSTINASTASGGGVITSADASGILQLQTAGTTAVTIDASQNVGIGTSSPAAKLDVAATIRSTANVTPTSGSGLEIIGGSSSNFIVAYNRTTPAFLPLELQSSIFTVATAGSERMRINSSGNVGIGTSSPGVKLDVTGSQYIRWGNFDALTINGSSTNSVGLRIQNTVASGRNWNIGSSGGGVGAAGSFFIFDDTAGAGRLIIDSSGNLLVGQTTQITTEKFGTTGSNIVCALTGTNTGNVSTLRIQRYQSDGDGVTFYYGTNQKGYISITSTGTTYNSISDYRLKENVVPMVGALDRVMQLNPVSYVWKDNQKADEGFIAHEVKNIVPSAVAGEKDELDDEGNPKYQGLDQSRIVSVLTAAIQELKTIIDTQNARIEALEAK